MSAATIQQAVGLLGDDVLRLGAIDGHAAPCHDTEQNEPGDRGQAGNRCHARGSDGHLLPSLRTGAVAVGSFLASDQQDDAGQQQHESRAANDQLLVPAHVGFKNHTQSRLANRRVVDLSRPRHHDALPDGVRSPNCRTSEQAEDRRGNQRRRERANEQADR